MAPELTGFGGAFVGRRVLVTGHTGFKGGWLAFWLQKLGAKVYGLALAPEPGPSLFDAVGLEGLVHHSIGDIREPEVVNNAFTEARPDFVFHLAAQALVRPSYDDPKTTFDTNIGGTVNVLEAVRCSETVRSAVIVTSDKVYENREWYHAYRENDAMGGHDPYSASKGATELVVSSYRRSFFQPTGQRGGVGIATARAGNVVGGGDWARDRIIPDCVRALTDRVPIEVRNPESTRPWQHVLEPLSGYLCLGASLKADPSRHSEAFNFGPSLQKTLTVGELTNAFVEAWGEGEIRTPPQQAAPHEARRLNLSCAKADAILGWRCLLGPSETIDWAVEWYRRWHDARGEGALAEFASEQIRRYTELGRKEDMPWTREAA